MASSIGKSLSEKLLSKNIDSKEVDEKENKLHNINKINHALSIYLKTDKYSLLFPFCYFLFHNTQKKASCDGGNIIRPY